MRAEVDPRTARWIGIRIGVLAVLLAAAFGAIAARVFWLQVLRRDELAGEAVDQYLRELVLRPRRGVVTDRTGVLLAGSADSQSVYADPRLLAGNGRRDDLARRADLLRRTAQILKVDARALERKLAKGGRFVWLERRVSPEKAAALQAFLDRERVKAIRLVPETRRYYPKTEVAGQVLGIVDEDGGGREGIELSQDDWLRGEPERVPSLRDGRGRMVLTTGAPGSGREREGARVELTLDQSVQAQAERALARAVTGSRALAGTAVVLEVGTGEVLALATYPTANANAARSADALRDRPVTDAFEPGSTLKAMTLAGALEDGVFTAHDVVDCGNGSLTIGSHTIHDTHPIAWAGASRILAESSNIGAAKVAAKLGRERLQGWLQAFGFGERTGVGLPGEVRGVVSLARSDVALATQAFGQGPITASALQITNAMAVIANGGQLVRPRILRRVVDPATGEVIEATHPEVVRRVVSAATAQQISRWLLGVIEEPHGTGKRARLDGWRAVGKTGTAQKADRISGGYSADRRFSSFVGFAPYESPRFVIGIFIDEPKGETFGGQVAAPAFKEIAEFALRVSDAQPLATASPAAAVEPLAPDEEEPEPPAVEWAAEADDASGHVAVPALAGLPARTAIRRLEESDLGADVAGSGRVVSQSPAPGKVVERGTRVRMTLAPPG
ncbi:penicillin-binding protein [Anaeromyxobacter oryzae]|uniref:Penicillin-binding protein n=1 Tax=Anaeromyxobacter oryzae TaxID=2918170 RepID=A0ABN6MNR2_9BACT|nr:penicillin-binding protein [Anaeromyxobacter oryzae]BDG02682.1 penicillin-binding protein [Anaeromyxobacter oryzae]